MAASRAAQRVGVPQTMARRLAAAIRELESNIVEHSGKPDTGIIAFQATYGAFEFVVADRGIGTLATLRQAPEFSHVTDHGSALDLVLREGVSRYGRSANRGMGFRDLFLGLAAASADLRFRSGDHALSVAGFGPNPTGAALAQKPYFAGFLASVVCHLEPRQQAS